MKRLITVLLCLLFLPASAVTFRTTFTTTTIVYNVTNATYADDSDKLDGHHADEIFDNITATNTSMKNYVDGNYFKNDGTQSIWAKNGTFINASGLDGAKPVTVYLYSTSDGTWTADSIYAQVLFGNADTNGNAGVKAAIKSYVANTNGGKSGLSFWISNNGSSGLTEAAKIDNQGYFGVKVTNPLAPFHTASTADTTAIFDVYSGGNTTAVSTGQFLGRSARGNATSPVAVTTDDILMFFGGRGYNGAAFTLSKASMGMFTAEPWNATSNGAYISLWTTPKGTTAQSERARISDAGNFLVGTTTDNGNKTRINGNLDVTGDLYYGGSLYSYSPLMLGDDVCMKDHATGKWAKCGLYNYAFSCSPDLYCEMKATVLQDRRTHPADYEICTTSNTEICEEDGICTNPTVCEQMPITAENLGQLYLWIQENRPFG